MKTVTEEIWTQPSVTAVWNKKLLLYLDRYSEARSYLNNTFEEIWSSSAEGSIRLQLWGEELEHRCSPGVQWVQVQPQGKKLIFGV